MFGRGGFHLQVGNPPWVRPDWDESGVLAEVDPWWQLTDKPAEAVKVRKREETLQGSVAIENFLNERADQAGVKEHLGSAIDRPVLNGLQPDLYRCFMERTWRSMSADGVVGLIHPESHFTELRAKELRRGRRIGGFAGTGEFRNEHKLFAEINDTRQFGVHTYGCDRGLVDFVQAAWLYHPETATRSLVHDGSGPVPGIKNLDGRWDASPHRDRIVHVDLDHLAGWAALIDEPETPT